MQFLLSFVGYFDRDGGIGANSADSEGGFLSFFLFYSLLFSVFYCATVVGGA
ncbi:hypothetical protein LY76DRAFT_180403 [Colletotrichum caudatum]|nr:hypothetical protein LY76DRAFT_180403 [Colletotrichum caudatum]